jgi:putative transposase
MAQQDDASAIAAVVDLFDENTRDLFRRLLQQALQDLIEAELTAVIGAGRHERCPSRSNWRNGGRSRMLATPAGDLELRIPKVREGSFFPGLLEPRRRVDQALWAVIMEAYVHGTSTRKVDDLVRALGIDSGVSKSTVSRICKDLDEQVEVFRSRPLDHTGFFVRVLRRHLHQGPRRRQSDLARGGDRHWRGRRWHPRGVGPRRRRQRR